MIELSEIERIAFSLQEQQGIKVTAKAQEFIHVLLNNIADDPHPSWRATPEANQFWMHAFAERLPVLLNDIAQKEHTKRITTYDVVHWLAPQLASLCPFSK